MLTANNLLSIGCESGLFCELDPLVKVISIISRLGLMDFSIVDLSRVIDHLDHNTFVQNGRPFPDIQEGIRLFVVYDFV